MPPVSKYISSGDASMGRTIPSAAIQYMSFVKQMEKFKRGIGRSDGLVVDDLLVMANQHVAEVAYAGSPLPEQLYLLAMILEEHKIVMGLQERVEVLRME
jgi:hypothetical protein